MSHILKEAKELLLIRKAELTELAKISLEDRATVVLDQQSVGRLSRMDALQRQAMAQANARQRARELQRINSALHRITEDEYGFCNECGEDIPEARLRVDPAALYCVSCAKLFG
ncbi:RNA polymerase-binding transcription factor DksA [Pseudovibrio axinellae]|uniref:RNA polymerase-binding transcription factor DksA n=1 Tax=Pseudovibrio axinellae TaxID=989403 RepID=A0A165UKL0_9HYPH|nr:TraR/DksA family transcriptional regulator [Pseudovibrio axinellae]KZL12473.1 RNA polymerase-binding transcription factor DksA [Pseudovibrio axinellae]SEP70691.1 transcriptional regulator, TraR/DksA family [Pseudovibrio axinellae]